MNDLRDQLDEALERIRQLEEELRGTTEAWPADWGFTTIEKTIMTSLMRHEVSNKENLYFSLYGHKANPPGAKVVEVHICKINKKLKALGIKTNCLWGKGYFISPEDKAFIREMMRFGPTVPRFLEQRNSAPESTLAPQ